MAPSLRDLIDFLLAEIALCGDQGALFSDVLIFIDTFYKTAQDESKGRSHVVDRRFQEKVWSWLTRNPEVSVGKNKEGNLLRLEEVEHATQNADTDNPPIRIFVSKERTWLALTGHEPDETKVLPTEFALLSIIASRKSEGVIQTELVKLSGQDKRSVPKRTEMLQQKGYIEKRAVQMKSTRTSLCTLRRFAKLESISTNTPAKSAPGVMDRRIDVIDFEVFNDRLFKILKEFRVISRDDLKQMLGFADPWRWRVLSRALRKFERIGVLKRVRAMSQYADTMKKLHPCVMLLRDPTERDFELFHEFSRSILNNLGQEDNVELDEDVDGSLREPPQPTDADTVGIVKREEDVEEVGRTIPTWTPDRNIHNLLFETVDSAGIYGKTNYSIIRSCFGGFFRRPLENALTRLVECWQLSQPLHLRHLAIVRDTALQRTVTHYVHYSAVNFQKLVDAGEASWEAVEFVNKAPKTDPITVPSVDVLPQLNEYGLPIAVPTKELLRNGNSTLLECLMVGQPTDYVLSGSDPVPVRLENGVYGIRYGHQKLPAGALQRFKSKTRGRPKGTPNRLKGTPNRPKGTPTRPKVESQENPIMPLEIALSAKSALPKSHKKSKYDRFKGMPLKEKLEALGLDETWTEYSVLLIERPTPGVYVTPRGRRRPAGKRQGRPRISRFAVFKSPKLADFPWFVEEKGEDESEEEEEERESTIASPLVSQGLGIETPAVTPAHNGLVRSSRAPEAFSLQQSETPEVVATPSRKSKRRRSPPRHDSLEAGSIPATPGSPGLPAKQRRLHGPEKVDSQDVDLSTVQGSVNQLGDASVVTNVTETISNQLKRKRTKSPDHPEQWAAKQVSDVSQDHDTDAAPVLQVDKAKRPRSDQTEVTPIETTNPYTPSLENGTTIREGSTVLTATPSNNSATNNHADLTSSQQHDLMVVDTPTDVPQETHEMREHEASQTPDGHKRWHKKKTDKGGSVAFLRRKIIMDIVEKAGGAYPMGTEVWYPFVTAWMKTKYKEKPDLRTVRSTVKQMIDTSKLRQLTFSGKDSKGVMVTKKILVKSDLAPDDPIVQDLQKNMLSTEGRFYIPPNTEIDPDISKSGIKGTPNRDPKTIPQLPVEHGLTVQLQKKPAFVVAQERRRGLSIQRKLLESLGLGSDAPKRRSSGVVRLEKIQRAAARGSAMNNLTSISRPRQGIDSERRRFQKRYGAVRRLISSFGPYAMTMSTRQKFHPATGTYSTDAGFIAFRGGRQGIDTESKRFQRRYKAPGLMKRPISSIGAYAMTMNPNQTFHSATGTFSTDASFVARRKPVLELPESLEDLLSQTRRRSVDNRTESSQFFSNTDRILRWELENEDLLLETSADLRYINQTVHSSFESTPIDGNIRFAAAREGLGLAPSKQRRRSARQATDWAVNFLGESFDPSEPGFANTWDLEDFENYIPKNRRLTKLSESIATDGIDTSNAVTSTPASRQAARRQRSAYQLSQLLVQRIISAIVVVRSLAGGSEGKFIDWNLVAKAFPGHDAKLIQERGKNILNRNRLQVTKMQSDFQERFIEAYANDQVPQIDYDNLRAYDWEAVVDWANTQLDVPTSEKLPDLPATREQFDSVFELREEAPTTLDEIFQTSQTVTTYRKRALFAGVPYAVPLDDQASKTTPRKTELSRLDVAKTWVRANVITPEDVYRPAEARQALEVFGDALVGSAVQSLVTERAISMGHGGRITPGRNYDITDFFLFTLGRKRAIESAQLRRAARFKTTVLDPELQERGCMEVGFNSEDGDTLALINLVSGGKVLLKPRDPPRDKYGLTEGGYLTRQMDKDKLRFTIEVHPVEGSYVYGNPISERMSSIPPPCPPRIQVNSTISLPEKIPIWFDIHGGFVKVLWELVVAAVVGCVAMRPGIDAASISSMVKPMMGAWEIQLLLEWMYAVGIVRRVGEEAGEQTTWVVEEWWWMALG